MGIKKLANQESAGHGQVEAAAPPLGYANPEYAVSLSEFGEPLELPRSGGWLLKRKIRSAPAHDAMGCYPIFACRNWSRIAEDLAALENTLVSVTLVADPFGGHREQTLRHCFPDLCLRYKDHYVVDLDRVSLDSINSHHRRNVRRGLRDIAIEFCEDPVKHVDDWCRLYGHLVTRHNITGIAAFSADSFRGQIRVPGLVMQRAACDGETVGMILWYLSGNVAYYHLGAYSERGYELRASYALFWTAMENFRGTIETVALGAAAGVRSGGGSGLDRFKAGWATGTRPAFLCGRILSPDRYAALTSGHPTSPKGYFPAYRHGEIR